MKGNKTRRRNTSTLILTRCRSCIQTRVFPCLRILHYQVTRIMKAQGAPFPFEFKPRLWPPARFIFGGRCVNSAALVNNQPVYVLFQSVFNWEASKRSGSVFMFFFPSPGEDKWTNPVVHQGNFFYCSLWTVASNVIRVKALFVLSCPLLYFPITGHVYKGERPLNKCSFHLVWPWKSLPKENLSRVRLTHFVYQATTTGNRQTHRVNRMSWIRERGSGVREGGGGGG